MCESIDLVILARVSLRFAIQNPNQILIPVGTPFLLLVRHRNVALGGGHGLKDIAPREMMRRKACSP